jgi:hypothetical protein
MAFLSSSISWTYCHSFVYMCLIIKLLSDAPTRLARLAHCLNLDYISSLAPRRQAAASLVAPLQGPSHSTQSS